MIHAIFFLSGVSALLFQHIWFRQAGLVFGNSVWAASLVLSSFMAGLAIGNGLAARLDEWKKPLRWYALLELVVAFTGMALVFGLPSLGEGFIPSFVARMDPGVAQGTIRFVMGFALLVIPTAAMGMTLPVLVSRAPPQELYGATLGRLYGWNTFGAVFGALAGEAFLYEAIGIRSTGLVAGGLNITAALLSLTLAGQTTRNDEAPARPKKAALHATEIRILSIAALAGGCFLALEVVWTRFLQLFLFGTALTFSIMLAMALAGMSIGSLLAARAPKLFAAPAAVPLLSMLAALSVTASYSVFADVLALDLSGLGGDPWTRVAALSAALILPSAVVSGMLFASLGSALARSQAASRATGLLTLANTLGAMIGALLAGFALLPMLGMERSFQALALMYTVAAAISPGFLALLKTSRRLLAATAISLLFSVLFPTGLMARVYIWNALNTVVGPGTEWRVSGFREGLTETITYIDTLAQGETMHTRLVTNGFSMSGTMFAGRRYMEAFVYLPVAIHPGMRRALLISYGVGMTARALTQTRELEHIDVVDISRDILDMSHHAVGAGDRPPLSDPRVTTHTEDGRFFLQTSTGGYDLITSEPPPPHLGGVVNLYTREYFELLKSRLNPQGIVSYWLPVHSLSDNDAQAISSAFCAVFEDCTLWKGMNLDWILVGTRDLKGAVSTTRFKEQWNTRGPDDIGRIGIEIPEQLGALFMADGRDMKEMTQRLPLEDNFPGRLSPTYPRRMVFGPWRKSLMDANDGRRRFEASSFIKDHWPSEMIGATLPYFDVQSHYDRMVNGLVFGPRVPPPVTEAVDLLRGTVLSVLPAMLLGNQGDTQMLFARNPVLKDEGFWAVDRATQLLSTRRYDLAIVALRDILVREPSNKDARQRLVLALCLNGQTKNAAADLLLLPPDLDPSWRKGIDHACKAEVVAR